ncbi:hypothetical protein BRC2024_HCTLARHO_CDS_0107 [Acinetobacter phage vB_AbaS_Silvergun]
MTKQKKPKTGDVVGWVVVSEEGQVLDEWNTRQKARKSKQRWAKDGERYYIGRIKIVG